MGILWTIIIGFIAGVIAKFLMPGDNEPSGFILTTILGIVGAFVATYLGQAIGWYRVGEGAGLIGAGKRKGLGQAAPVLAGLGQEALKRSFGIAGLDLCASTQLPKVGRSFSVAEPLEHVGHVGAISPQRPGG